MKILIIGAGMYVTGRDNTGVGTILSSIAESSKNINIEKVMIVAKQSSNKNKIQKAIKRINNDLGSNISVEYHQLKNDTINEIYELCGNIKFDASVIAIPDHLHFIYTKALLENNVHCIVVKPLAPSFREAKELQKIQVKNNCHAVVEFHKRWDETNLYVKRIFKENKLGDPIFFSVDYSQKINIPTKIFRKWVEKTNIFQYLGVHYVDLFYFLTGYKPYKAMAIGVRGTLFNRGINTFDSVHAIIIWKKNKNTNSECITNYNISWIDPNCTSAMSDQKYKLIGTKGRVDCNQKNRGLEVVCEDEGIITPNPYFSEYLPDETGGLYFSGYAHKSIYRFLNDVNSLITGKVIIENINNDRPSFSDSLVSSVVIDAVNNSLNNDSSWVDIKDIN